MYGKSRTSRRLTALVCTLALICSLSPAAEAAGYQSRWLSYGGHEFEVRLVFSAAMDRTKEFTLQSYGPSGEAREEPHAYVYSLQGGSAAEQIMGFENSVRYDGVTVTGCTASISGDTIQIRDSGVSMPLRAGDTMSRSNFGGYDAIRYFRVDHFTNGGTYDVVYYFLLEDGGSAGSAAAPGEGSDPETGSGAPAGDSGSSVKPETPADPCAGGQHNWKYNTTEATCIEEGKTVRICTVCGEEDIVSTAPKTSHKWERRTDSSGGAYQVCAVCGETKAESAAAPSGTKESPVSKDASAKAAASDNRNRNNYSSYASAPMTSFLYRRSDGNLTRVEAIEGGVVVETYSPGFELLTARTVPMELSKFGGFYSGAGYHFLIFGQDNPGEDDGLEVVRVVKYSKDWERLGAASLRGANTTVPFRSCSLRCAERDGYLYVHTAHQMYKSSDGLNHQANLTMAVRESDMQITYSRYGVSNVGTGYVSHSFNQFILAASDGSVVTLDHGDAYPRAAVSVRYAAGSDGRLSAQANVNVKEFPGAVGANNTDASFGGFEESASHYLAVGNYGQGSRSAVSYAVGKSAFNAGSVKSFTLGAGAYTPQLVKLSDSRFLALWNSKGESYQSDSLNYVFLDGTGAPSGSVQTAKAYLSDCQPIVADGKVVWYATGSGYDKSLPVFYTIDAASGAFSSAGGGTEAQPETKPGTQTGANSGTQAGTNSGTRTQSGGSGNPFTDVADGTYYHDAVLWALKNNITTGVTPTQFQPSAVCTRGQVVTFLWRAKGCPEPKAKTNPFTDVVASSPFYKAILWAQENGVTSGTTASTFNPGGTCTSAHVVTFLWRANGKPAASGASALAAANPGEYFTDAVAWADSSGLLSGVGAAFSPSRNSPRADIVTYLYRDLAQ